MGDNGKEKETTMAGYMGGCQNYGPFLGPHYNTAPNTQGTKKGTTILTTTYVGLGVLRFRVWDCGIRVLGLGFQGLGFTV